MPECCVVRLQLLLGAVRANTSQAPTVVARALYVVQSAVYDAWAAYDEIAVGINWQKDLVYRRPLAQVSSASPPLRELYYMVPCLSIFLVSRTSGIRKREYH